MSPRALGLPTSQRETFELLATSGAISGETAAAMAAMASLRNRIARSYGDLDPVRLAREAPAGLTGVGHFLDEITASILSAGG